MQTFYVVKYQNDTYAAGTIFEAIDLAGIESLDDTFQVGTVIAKDAGMARLLQPSQWFNWDALV